VNPEAARRIHHLADKTRHPFLKGCDDIIRTHLGLPPDTPVPLTVPHGVDSYQSSQPLGIHSTEPLYLGLNESFAQAAAKHKTVVRFPHPWLLLIHGFPVPAGAGTLFVAPPPSAAVFECMLERISQGHYEKPWGVLVKERGARRDDFDWWESRGFATHSAGPATDRAHFHKLRDILGRYRSIATPYMSSVVIFAVAMGRRAAALPDVSLECVETPDWPEVCRLDSPEATEAWRNLLSKDVSIARAQAEGLLGMQYWAPPDVLRARLASAIESIAPSPLHLYPLHPGSPVYQLCIALAAAGVPVHRLFPKPAGKIAQRIAALVRLQRLTTLSGSDLGHYGVAGSRVPLRMRKVFAFQLGRIALAGDPLRTDVNLSHASEPMSVSAPSRPVASDGR
jgi:hypothetical protein